MNVGFALVLLICLCTDKKSLKGTRELNDWSRNTLTTTVVWRMCWWQAVRESTRYFDGEMKKRKKLTSLSKKKKNCTQYLKNIDEVGVVYRPKRSFSFLSFFFLGGGVYTTPPYWCDTKFQNSVVYARTPRMKGQRLFTINFCLLMLRPCTGTPLHDLQPELSQE